MRARCLAMTRKAYTPIALRARQIALGAKAHCQATIQPTRFYFLSVFKEHPT